MTAPELDLLEALRQVIGDERFEQAQRWNALDDRRDASDLDEQTLRRSFGGLSSTARREQRRPVQLRVDEYGWGNDGRYYASRDGAA